MSLSRYLLLCSLALVGMSAWGAEREQSVDPWEPVNPSARTGEGAGTPYEAGKSREAQVTPDHAQPEVMVQPTTSSKLVE